MENSQYRDKCAMVLYALERDLGDYVMERAKDIDDLSPGVISKVRSRARNSAGEINNVLSVIAETYLEEIFQLAADVGTETEQEYAKRLKQMAENLSIYEIRNSVSHPNRPFLENYWYRIATIATDQSLVFLKREKVHEAFIKAREGTLEKPPDEWIKSQVFTLPNNLPETFDHDITGFVGRRKEINDLQRRLRNPRLPFVAIVAPGGVGKTALALELLKFVATDVSEQPNFDGIIYISLQTKKLTSDGVKNLDAPESIEELKRSLLFEASEMFTDINADDFETGIGNIKDKHILLCIDNLETLLRDEPEIFFEFHSNLPGPWRLFVTSRVAVDGASCLTLSELDTERSKLLARTYAQRRGITEITEDELETIASSTGCNPLAIRLTIDLIGLGRDVPSSLNLVKSEIAEFSYRNLVNALSGHAVSVLETLFLQSKLDRTQIAELLDFNVDKVADAIGVLKKTSLIMRADKDDSIESYQLNDAMKDLLITNPRNIAIRTKLVQRINKWRALGKEVERDTADSPFDEFEWYYLPDDLHLGLKSLLRPYKKPLAARYPGKEIAIKAYTELRPIKDRYKNEPTFNAYFGKTQELLGDVVGAEESYKTACLLSGGVPKFRMLLARFYHDNQRFGEALKIYENLKAEGYDDPEKLSFENAIKFIQGYFLAKIFNNQFSEVIEETADWKNGGKFRGVLGIHRASAIKRSAERILDNDLHLGKLKESVEIIDDVFQNDGVFGSGVRVANKCIDELIWLSSTRKLSNENQVSETLICLEPVLDSICSSSALNLMGSRHRILSLASISCENNPFQSDKWEGLTRSAEVPTDELKSDFDNGLIIEATISNVPSTGYEFSNFLFAQGNDGEDYFLHIDQFRSGDWAEWKELAVGSVIYIRPDRTKDDIATDKAKKVSDIYISRPH